MAFILKKINNDLGLTYTLEALLGIALILGTTIYMTGMLPPTAQKTGEHSKVQLVNIGRDAMDLIELTPITDIFSNYSQSQGVYRNYTLVADKTFVAPGGNVTFTIKDLESNVTVYKNLTLEKTVLGLKTALGTIPINGSTIWNFSSVGEYNIRAYEGLPDSPTSWSNYVTVYVGYYFLDTDIDGISENGSKVVDGVVSITNGSGVPDLAIQILDYKYGVLNNSAAKTAYGKIIEDFENASDWTSDRILSLNNTVKTQGNSSLSLNGMSSFWINRINDTVYKLNYYDILSFDFFSPTAGEKIHIELSNSTNSSNKFIWNNINVAKIGWNKINFGLKYPDEVKGTISSGSVDAINITVSNITSYKDYFFDNLTAGAGRFSFNWTIISTGSYYIQAIDASNNTSNKHRIVFSKKAGGLGYIYALQDTIYETETTKIILIPNDPKDNLAPISGFNINLEKYNCYDLSKINMTFDTADPNHTTVDFTGNVAGDYYIFYGETGGGCGVGPGVDPANGAKTNAILIHVLPLQAECVIVECPTPKCSGLKMTDLNFYLRNYVPYYVNYNLYLINPDGTLCKDCPEFKEIINGYPTDEAVTVNKIFRLKTVNGEYLRELRMVLWYK